MKESDKSFLTGIIFGFAIVMGLWALAQIGEDIKPIQLYTYRILEQEGNCKDVCFGHYMNNTPELYDTIFNPLKQTRNDEKGELFCGVSRYGILHSDISIYCFCEFEINNCYA